MSTPRGNFGSRDRCSEDEPPRVDMDWSVHADARTLVLSARRVSTGAVHYSRDRTIEAQYEACISGRYPTRGEGPRQLLRVASNPGAHQARGHLFGVPSC